MKERPVSVRALPGDFVAPDDEGLFAFIESLRGSVRAKVATDQQRGLSLGEIVVQVRAMVRFAEEDPDLAMQFPAQTYRAISRQAVAWCIEAYRPTAFTAGHQFVADTLPWNPKSALQLLATTLDATEPALIQSPVK